MLASRKPISENIKDILEGRYNFINSREAQGNNVLFEMTRKTMKRLSRSKVNMAAGLNEKSQELLKKVPFESNVR